MEACRAASRGSRSQFAIPLSTLTIDEALAIALATGAMHKVGMPYSTRATQISNQLRSRFRVMYTYLRYTGKFHLILSYLIVSAWGVHFRALARGIHPILCSGGGPGRRSYSKFLAHQLVSPSGRLVIPLCLSSLLVDESVIV